MRTSASMAAETIASTPAMIAGLRERLAILSEAGWRKPEPADCRLSSCVPFDIPVIDARLGGGLRRGGLHEIRAVESRDAAAVTGFAAALLARLSAADLRPLLWIVESSAAQETGVPYAAGLRRFGIDPRRLIVVRVAKPLDALWVFEEGLNCAGLCAVVTDLYANPRQLDLTASRRLALRAAAQGVTGLLLRVSAEAEPGAANTRWLVTSLPAAEGDERYPDGIGFPAWRLTLERNRQGAIGTFDVEWNHGSFRAFPGRAARPANSRSGPPLSPHRPAAPPDAGKVVALHLDREELPREQRRLRLQARG